MAIGNVGGDFDALAVYDCSINNYCQMDLTTKLNHLQYNQLYSSNIVL